MAIISAEQSQSTEQSKAAGRNGALELLIKEAREASKRRRLGWFTFFIVTAVVATLIASLAVARTEPSSQIGSGIKDATGRTVAAAARVSCHDVLGARALNSEPTKVGAVRQFGYGPDDLHPAPNAFQGLGANQVVRLCWTGRSNTSYQLYAVASHYQPVRIEGVTGVGFKSTPPPGFIDIP
jgi:hypothetical protein